MKKKGTVSFESPDKLNVIVEGSKVIGDMITESNLRIDGEVVGNVSASSKVVISHAGLQILKVRLTESLKLTDCCH